jgi:hypothetical protein
MTDDLELIYGLAKIIYRSSEGPDGPEIFLAEPWRSCIRPAIYALGFLRGQLSETPTDSEMYSWLATIDLHWQQRKNWRNDVHCP